MSKRRRYPSDRNLREFRKLYEHMPDHELDRKRNICRENKRKGHRVEHCGPKHDVIWEIQSRRGRRQHWRERRAELRAWIGLTGTLGFAGFLLTKWQKIRPDIEAILSSILEWL